ncbi:EAL domain-containing protein [Cognatiluteimonas lumbrici]|uniref:EAL domain-containing protein n=1 Tax=Cognatiluteimonas lumbrici TaxID=2559601 RepID=UPI001C7093A3|nr:EAL domain-containing protein [Luteimonas lumbrici]
MRALFAALLLVALAGAGDGAGAAEREYYFERAGGGEALAQNSVTAIARDADGFVWVGTQGGLHRYDGRRYTLYQQDPRVAGSLPDSFVTALQADDDGLWIGTYSQYVARLDLGTGAIRAFSAEGDAEAQRVFALLVEPGVLWVGTGLGLERLDPATGARHAVLTLDEHAGLRQALARGSDGALWYATGQGLFRVAADGSSRKVSGEPVLALARDPAGTLWAGGHHRLWRIGEDGVPVQAWPREGGDAGAVTGLAIAPDGAVWFAAAPFGLRRLDPATGEVRALRQDHAIAGALPEDTVNTLFVDGDGLLWVGGQYHGLAVAESTGARFRYLVDPQRRDSDGAIVDSSIRSVFEDRAQRLWLGTDDGRLLRYADGAGFEDFTRLLPQAPTPDGLRVMGFADDGSGQPWVATSVGLFRFDPAVPEMREARIPSIDRPALRSIALDREGTLWLGTDDAGVIRFEPGGTHAGRVRRIPFIGGDPSGLSHPQVHAVLVAVDGKVWIGTSRGLDLFDPASGMLRHFRRHAGSTDGLAGDIVRALWEDHQGTLWVGSHGGLNRVALEGGQPRFTQPLLPALANESLPVVFSLAGDNNGALWLGTNRGLMRYTPGAGGSPGSLSAFGLADGLQDLEFNGGAAARLRDGRLAFGGVGGLNVFDPARIRADVEQAPLRLLSLQVGAGQGAPEQPAWRRQRIELPESAEILRLRIGALGYLGNERIRYRYRIDGLDDDWIDNGNRGEITYTLLPAGDYVFRAQATRGDGTWNDAELRIPLVVTPPAWRHPLARAGYVLLAALLGVGAWLLWRRRRQLERRYFEHLRDREERLKLALWASGEQFWDYDLVRGELQRMRVTEDVRSASDIAVETEVESDHRIHADDLPLVRERLRQHVRGDTPIFLSEHRIPDGDGEWMWVRARGRVVERDGDGRARRLAGTARNITHSRHAEYERKISSEVLRSMAEAVCVLDAGFDFISINPAFSRMTGYTAEEVVGRNASLMDSAQHAASYYTEIRGELRHQGRWSGELWQKRKDGEEFLCAYECSSVRDSDGDGTLYVLVLNDITDQKRAEQELRYLANFDPLTNLPNRTLLAERLSRAIVRARRQGEQLALLFLDLDRFKDINDSLGHAAGDRILRATAARLQETVGSRHTVARLSGDEFTVMLEGLVSPVQAEATARDIIAAFEQPLLLEDHQEIAITPSIGISLYPQNAQTPSELLKQADTAMYQAKAAGRRTWMRYTEAMDVSIRQRATVSAALRKVLDRGELRLVFQPRLALAQSRIVGVEALLRWRGADNIEIPPAEFIPLAEESGLILEIGEWVLREACLATAQWHRQGLPGLGVSVNVSALQLLRGDFPGVVKRVLEETGLPPGSLELEITETVVMANAQHTADKLRAFRDLGVNLAIDDFGTGYSSLAYLKRLPINTLKIDKEFVDDLSQGSDDAAITTTVLAMARSLGLNVVAEGVETAAQLQFLRAHRCNEIQGYWLSPPLERQHCLAFIRGWSPRLAGDPGVALLESSTP